MSLALGTALTVTAILRCVPGHFLSLSQWLWDIVSFLCALQHSSHNLCVFQQQQASFIQPDTKRLCVNYSQEHIHRKSGSWKSNSFEKNILWQLSLCKCIRRLTNLGFKSYNQQYCNSVNTDYVVKFNSDLYVKVSHFRLMAWKKTSHLIRTKVMTPYGVGA